MSYLSVDRGSPEKIQFLGRMASSVSHKMAKFKGCCDKVAITLSRAKVSWGLGRG